MKNDNLQARFIEKLKKKAPEWELVGEYTDAKTMTLFRHKPCGKVFMKTPYIVTSKPNSCRFCNANRLRKPEKFYEAMKKKPDYEVLDKYVNYKTKIRIRHKVCGKTFYTTPERILASKEGCPYCKGKTISKAITWTNERFLEAVGERASEYEFLEPYQGAHTKIKVKHIPCGNIFEITPDTFLRGGRCKQCKYSTGEGQVYRWLKKELPNAKIIQGERSLLPNRAEIDIYLPEFKLGIEYDGLAYHTVEHFLNDKRRTWTKQKAENRQLWKTEECNKLGIRLVHIFEDEWLERPEVVKDKLRAILKLPMDTYYARNLVVKIVPTKEAKAFLDQNHIQGGCRMVVAYGLYSGDELLAVQAYNRYTRRRVENSEGEWELSRYATKVGTRIVGGFSRCLKHFTRDYSPKVIYSFADRRWCSDNDNVYGSAGFIKDATIPKSYWYIKAPKRYHKSEFRKDKIKKKYPEVYNPDKTEAQMTTELGLERLYDCGLIRYKKYPS